MTTYGPVFSVPWYMIVVSLHKVTCMAIPLSLHTNTRGSLERNITSMNSSLYAVGRVPTRVFNALSRYQPLVTNGKGPSTHKLGTAHFSYPVIRRSADAGISSSVTGSGEGGAE
ncbi:hypothetical protein N7G274_002607 [Stereocaulon virgatum]|uniref:Secreted protein n=1 Tax=Stereocaulon virgatum TaxID=373712 RepID=A0ABR4AG99_9LECA